MKLERKNISCIKLHLKVLECDFRYKPPQRGLFKTKPEGFRVSEGMGYYHFISMEEMINRNHYIIDDNRVYHKPHITFTMTNGKHHCVSFETQKDAQGFYDSLKGYLEI